MENNQLAQLTVNCTLTNCDCNLILYYILFHFWGYANYLTPVKADFRFI